MHILLGDTLGTSGSACQNFPSFRVTCRPPAATGISITTCHCCSAATGALLLYRKPTDLFSGEETRGGLALHEICICFDNLGVSLLASLLIPC